MLELCERYVHSAEAVASGFCLWLEAVASGVCMFGSRLSPRVFAFGSRLSPRLWWLEAVASAVCLWLEAVASSVCMFGSRLSSRVFAFGSRQSPRVWWLEAVASVVVARGCPRGCLPVARSCRLGCLHVWLEAVASGVCLWLEAVASIVVARGCRLDCGGSRLSPHVSHHFNHVQPAIETNGGECIAPLSSSTRASPCRFIEQLPKRSNQKQCTRTKHTATLPNQKTLRNKHSLTAPILLYSFVELLLQTTPKHGSDTHLTRCMDAGQCSHQLTICSQPTHTARKTTRLKDCIMVHSVSNQKPKPQPTRLSHHSGPMSFETHRPYLAQRADGADALASACPPLCHIM